MHNYCLSDSLSWYQLHVYYFMHAILKWSALSKKAVCEFNIVAIIYYPLKALCSIPFHTGCCFPQALFVIEGVFPEVPLFKGGPRI